MVALKMLGDWLEDSGWTGALVEAKIASTGVANSFVKASNVKRARRAHQARCMRCSTKHMPRRRRTGIGRYSIFRQMV